MNRTNGALSGEACLCEGAVTTNRYRNSSSLVRGRPRNRQSRLSLQEPLARMKSRWPQKEGQRIQGRLVLPTGPGSLWAFLCSRAATILCTVMALTPVSAVLTSVLSNVSRMVLPRCRFAACMLMGTMQSARAGRFLNCPSS
jgi:hypothetical protein